METAIIILKVSLAGSAGTFPAGSALTTTQEEAARLVAADIAYYASISQVPTYETTASKAAANRQKRSKK